MRKKYLALIALSALGLGASGSAALAAEVKFRNPLNTALSPAYSAYYDHDTSSAAKNYYCGSWTVYDAHRGTDFRANAGTPIYSGASGSVYYRYNECNTYGYLGSTCGGGFGNHLKIDHEGSYTDGVGWVSIYAHLQRDTAAWWQSIGCGGYVGRSGSSGNSSGPHLHFEARKYGYPNDDPFAGSCAGPYSFWVNQNGGIPTTQCQ